MVAVLHNPSKTPAFSVEERVAMLRELVGDRPRIEITSFHGLLVDFAKSQGAQFIVRGVRAFSDFEYEFQMALMNRKLRPDLETVFMMPADKYSYLSSRLVREVAQLGGSIQGLVPELVDQSLHARLDPAYKLRDLVVEEAKLLKRKPKPRKKS